MLVHLPNDLQADLHQRMRAACSPETETRGKAGEARVERVGTIRHRAQFGFLIASSAGDDGVDSKQDMTEWSSSLPSKSFYSERKWVPSKQLE